MAWTWVRRADGYALVPEDSPGATPVAVLAKEGGRWVLASKAGEVPLPKRPTFDDAERILASQGVVPSAAPPKPATPRPAAPLKDPKPKPAPQPKPKAAPQAAGGKPPAPFKENERTRLKRPNAGSFMGNPASTLRQSREQAVDLASRKGVGELRKQLERSHAELTKRLNAALTSGPGEDSFTAVQLRTTLEQVKAVLHDLTPELSNVVIQNGQLASTAAAEDAIRYIKQAEHQYRGVARPIAFKQAEALDRALKGTESSLLNRLQGDEKAGPGILARYGDAVIQRFEDRLQQRMIQGKTIAEVRDEITSDSEFLQGAPASWAERIVRTEVMGAHNRANFEVIQSVDQQTGGGMLKILCATFDSRTGADSYAVHGQIRRSNEPFQDWKHQYMTPPNRPNDREIVVAHFIEWPIPPELAPKSDAEVAARWIELGNKRSLPSRPLMSTVPLDQIGKRKEQRSKDESSTEEGLTPTVSG
jgi:outer membrane biosynthesis protein TonB